MTPETCRTCHWYGANWEGCGHCYNPRGTYDLPVTPDCSCGDWKAKQVEHVK